MFAPYVGGPKKMLSLLVTSLDKNINIDFTESLLLQQKQ